MGILRSVNLAHPHPGGGRTTRLTGIDKRPVDGPVRIDVPGDGASGLGGDHIGDPTVHGGGDQAVYAYAAEDLGTWEGLLGRTLPGGVFGENLTTLDVDVTAARIGERWRIGQVVVLEVTSPRVPCTTFSRWIDVPGWVKTFTGHGVPGAYLRVVTPGEVSAGDPVEVTHRPDHDVTIGLTFRAITTEPDLLPRLVGIDALAADVRGKVARRVGTAG